MHVNLTNVFGHSEGLTLVCHSTAAALYLTGTLMLANRAGLAVTNFINDSQSSKILAIAAGLFTSISIFAITNPLMSFDNALLFSATLYTQVILTIATISVVTLSIFLNMLNVAIIIITPMMSCMNFLLTYS